MWPIPSSFASLRVLQWVEPSLGPRCVRARIRASIRGVIAVGLRPLCRAYIPATPCSRKRPPPAADVRPPAAHRLLNAVVGLAVGEHQIHPCSSRIVGSAIARPNPSLESLSVLGCESNRILRTHAA